MFCGDDVEAVVGDVGTSLSKFGLAGEDTPTLVLPTAVGKKPPPPPVDGEAKPPQSYVIGDLHHARDVEVLRPIEACAVANWDALERIWGFAFDRLRVDPAAHPVITSAASCFANDALHNAASRDGEKYLELMFEQFRVPAFYMAKDAVLDAFAFGRSAALIAEIGAGATRVVPVFDGYALERPAQYSTVGCNQLSKYLAHLVTKNHANVSVRPRCTFSRSVNPQTGKMEVKLLPTEMVTPPLMPASYLKFMKAEVFRDMREATCLTSISPLPDNHSHGHSPHSHASKAGSAHVKQDYPANTGDVSFESARYELPDGQAVVLERERYQVGEFLLHPKNFETAVVKTEQHAAAAARTPAKGLHRMLYDAVQLCDADLRRDMLSNIILCGGGALTPGLTERLHAELSAMVPSTFKVRFTSVQKVERQFSVFIGASILASLGSFQQLWISKQEFEEVGAHALCADRFV